MNEVRCLGEFLDPLHPVNRRKLHFPGIGHQLPLCLGGAGKNQPAAALGPGLEQLGLAVRFLTIVVFLLSDGWFTGFGGIFLYTGLQ